MAEEPIVNPLVFQCKSCRNIVGDSFAFVSADKQLNTIAISQRSRHVELGTQLHFAQQDGPDKGSAYFELICTECRVVLGKQYQATPRLLDHLREVFSFDLSSISSYQLGSGEHNAATTVEEDNDTLPNGLPTMVELKEEINKIQSTLLPLTERLLRLENLFGNLLTKASVVTSAATGDDQQLTASERKKKRKSMQQPAVAAADENSLGRANVAL